MIDSLFADLPAQTKRPAKVRRAAGPPPVGAGWYGPPEALWLIPHPYMPGQPYSLRLSAIRGVEESDYSDRCFLALHGVREPLLAGVSKQWVLEQAPWAKDRVARKPVSDAEVGEGEVEANPADAGGAVNAG